MPISTAPKWPNCVLILSLLVDGDHVGPPKTKHNAFVSLDYTLGAVGRRFRPAPALAHDTQLRTQPVNSPDIWRSKTQPDIYQAVLKLLSDSFENPPANGPP